MSEKNMNAPGTESTAAAENAKSVRKKKTGKRLKKILKRIIAFLIILAILAAAGWILVSKLKQEYTVTYDTYTASIGTISNSLSFSGSLALIDSKIYTSSAETTVRAIYVAAGDKVTEGQKLAKLSNGQSIAADFAGTVNQVYVEEGDTVSNGTSLVQVADFEHMKISIRVDEYDISDVKIGTECRVTATATEQTFTSSIAAINYISASSGSVAYYTATAYVDVPDGSGVYPGMQTTVTIPQEEAENVVVLKLDAVSFDAKNNAFVYMMNESGEMYEVTIETGVSNGNYVEITSGLKNGDTVYVEAEVTTESSGLGSLVSSLFGGQQVNGGGRSGSSRGDFSDIDMSNFTMPDMSGNGGGSGSGGGGSMPSFGGGGGQK